MNRRFLAIAALVGVLAVACGKYGPPVRTHADPPTAPGAEASGASPSEEPEEREGQP